MSTCCRALTWSRKGSSFSDSARPVHPRSMSLICLTCSVCFPQRHHRDVLEMTAWQELLACQTKYRPFFAPLRSETHEHSDVWPTPPEL
ncbi:hypothetical protein AOLI_G00142440 [Acnodon oligacanthus]